MVWVVLFGVGERGVWGEHVISVYYAMSYHIRMLYYISKYIYHMYIYKYKYKYMHLYACPYVCILYMNMFQAKWKISPTLGGSLSNWA